MAGPGEGAGGADNSQSFLPAINRAWDWLIAPSRQGLRSNTRLSPTPTAPQVAPSRLTQAPDNGTFLVQPPGAFPIPEPPQPAGNGLGHWEPLGPGGKLVYIGADGQVAIDPDTGTPILFNADGGGGGGDTGLSASIAAAQQAADRAERAREYDQTYARGVVEFDRQFDRRAFENDRDYEQAKQQFAQQFAENQRQFNVGEQNRLSLAREAEAGTNARFGAQQAAEAAQFGAQYGLNAANAENQFNQSAYQTDVTDAMNRYNAQEASRARLSDLALQRDAQAREILKSPSDALARLFFQRGGTSPSPFVSQADLLDRLSAQISAAAPGALPASVARPTFVRPAPYTAPAPFVAPSSNLTPITQPTAAAGRGTNDAIRDFYANLGGPADPNSVVYQAAKNAGYTPPVPGQYPAHAQGTNGFVRERLSVVGDMPSGKGGNPEAVINPTNAPLAVVPLDKESTSEDKDEVKALKAKGAALQYLTDPKLAHMMVDEIHSHRQRLSKSVDAAADAAPHHALGTFSSSYNSIYPGWNDYSSARAGEGLGVTAQNAEAYNQALASQRSDINGLYARLSEQTRAEERAMANPQQPALPNASLALPHQSQEDLASLAMAATGPAGQALLNGGSVNDLRFTDYTGAQQALPSAIQYSRLTDAEKQNLQPVLAAKYNMTLQDLTDQLTARYGGTRSRRESRLSLR